MWSERVDEFAPWLDRQACGSVRLLVCCVCVWFSCVSVLVDQGKKATRSASVGWWVSASLYFVHARMRASVGGGCGCGCGGGCETGHKGPGSGIHVCDSVS